MDSAVQGSGASFTVLFEAQIDRCDGAVRVVTDRIDHEPACRLAAAAAGRGPAHAALDRIVEARPLDARIVARHEPRLRGGATYFRRPLIIPVDPDDEVDDGSRYTDRCRAAVEQIGFAQADV